MAEEVVLDFRAGLQMSEFNLIPLLTDAIKRRPISTFAVSPQNIDIAVKRDCFPSELMAELGVRENNYVYHSICLSGYIKYILV